MNRMQKIAVGAAVTVSTLTGGALGAALLNGSATAQTTTSTPSQSGTAPADTSNKDAAHEAAETPQQAADEAAGKRGGRGPHMSNHDAAHEAAESPERAAQEAKDDAAFANGSTSTSTSGQ